jgi:hypothetical protein
MALAGNNAGSGSNIGFSMFMASGNLTTLISAGGTQVISKAIAVAQGSQFAFGFRYKTGASPAAFRGRVNGGADSTAVELNPPSASNASAGVGLFGTSAAGGSVFGGDFDEMLIFPSDFSDANMAKLFTYINIRWGLF